jgi:hypothetical protein
MAKQKLFPEPPNDPDTREPHERFKDLASRVVSVPKEKVDEREREWKREHWHREH